MFSYVLISSFFDWSKRFLPSILKLRSFISTFGREYPVCTFLSASFSNDYTKSLFTTWKLGSIKWSKHGFLSGYNFPFVLYFFQLIVLLKPNFNDWSSFALPQVDSYYWDKKFCIGYCKSFCTCRIVITQVDDHVKMRLISQMINGISRVT